MADGAVEHFGDFGISGKEERKIENLQFLFTHGEGRERTEVELLYAALHGLQHLFFGAERGVGEDLDFDLAVCRFCDIGGKACHCQSARMLLGKTVPEAGFGGINRPRRKQAETAKQGGEQCLTLRGEGMRFHGVSLMVDWVDKADSTILPDRNEVQH